MTINRDKYLTRLLQARSNDLVKVITGGRRCGKSYLLFRLFRDKLIEEGVDESHMIELSLDERRNAALRNPDKLLDYVESRIPRDGGVTYVMLDEIQLADDFAGVLLSLMHRSNLQIYVTGSNSKFLSKDIITEFRGRGSQIRVRPLSFSEYYAAAGGSVSAAWHDYYTYGGLPQILSIEGDAAKQEYLRDIYELTYLRDIIERNNVSNDRGLRELVQILASSIGSATNPRRISNTFGSAGGIKISDKTLCEYIGYLQDAFLIEEALRYDVKGRKYIGTETKYYFGDLGLRNIALNLRQQEETHIMENVIYNELRNRGFLVDVGRVDNLSTPGSGGEPRRSNLEVDFVANKGADRIYIQSAYALPDAEKVLQEKRPLAGIRDSFRKIIITAADIKRKIDDDGIATIGLFEFLLDENSLVW